MIKLGRWNKNREKLSWNFRKSQFYKHSRDFNLQGQTNVTSTRPQFTLFQIIYFWKQKALFFVHHSSDQLKYFSFNLLFFSWSTPLLFPKSLLTNVSKGRVQWPASLRVNESAHFIPVEGGGHLLQQHSIIFFLCRHEKKRGREHERAHQKLRLNGNLISWGYGSLVASKKTRKFPFYFLNWGHQTEEHTITFACVQILQCAHNWITYNIAPAW